MKVFFASSTMAEQDAAPSLRAGFDMEIYLAEHGHGSAPLHKVKQFMDERRVYFASQSVGTTQQTPATSLALQKMYFADQAGGDGRLDKRYGDLASARGEPMHEINILTSFHYFKRVKLKDVQARFPGSKVNIFADSGGFSASTQGAAVRLADYVRWLQANLDDLHIYANLDVIGDPEKTKRNQVVLEAEGLAPIPVFHVGSDFKYLDEMLERYSYIALGGMVPYMKDQRKQLGAWVYKVFARIADRAVKVHGFGLGTSWDIVKNFPWHSIDSSAWTSAFQFRTVSVFDSRRGAFEQIDLGKGSKEVLRHQALLHEYGFVLSDFYPPAKFSYVKAGALSVLSVLRAERWLQEREVGNIVSRARA